MEPVEGFIEEDESDEDEGFIDPSFDPNNAEASVGPLPNDRRMSTSTQEAVYIYQASARAADKIHDAHIKNLGQTEGNREEAKLFTSFSATKRASIKGSMEEVKEAAFVTTDSKYGWYTIIGRLFFLK